jgi:hypothetical protein
VRVQFEFSEDSVKELDALREKLNVKNRGEVLLHSVGLLKWLVKELKGGSKIRVRRSDGSETEVVFTNLESILAVLPDKERTQLTPRGEH